MKHINTHCSALNLQKLLLLFLLCYKSALTAQCHLDFSFEKDSTVCYQIKLKNNSVGNNLIYEWDLGNGYYLVTESDSAISSSYFGKSSELNQETVFTLRAYYKQQGLCEAPKPCGMVQKKIKLDTMVRSDCFFPSVCSLGGQVFCASPSYTSACNPKKIFFYPFMSCSNQFLIDFGNGSSVILNTNNGNSFDYNFPTEGNYNITVTSLDGNNQPSDDSPNSFTQKLNVTCTNSSEYGSNNFFLPNAFLPNNDGNNDTYSIQGDNKCLTKLSIKVFDRWGEKVFESENPNFMWDGTSKGKLLNPSVYVYNVSAEFSNGQKLNKKGNITLLK